jgi:hypothetical protein
MSGFTNLQNLVIDGKASGDTLYGSPNADVVYGGEGSDTIAGLNGGDTLYGGDGASDEESDTFQYFGSGESAATIPTYVGSNTTFSIPGSGVDTLHGDISDLLDLPGIGWTAVNQAAVQVNGSIDKSVFATAGRDAVVFKGGSDYFLAFETSLGSAGTFGNMEILKLVGIVDDTDKFSVAANSSVSFIA